MANIKTDSPLSRRIVRAFLDFLHSVEPSPGVDYESIEVAKECLSEVFNIGPADDHSQTNPDQLVSIFNSLEINEQQKQSSKASTERSSVDASSTSTGQNVSDAKFNEGSQNLNQGKDSTKQSYVSGTFDDELFGQFFVALEKDHYFKPASDGSDDQVQLDRATKSFHNALKEMQKNGVTFDQKNLAEAFKILGNKALQSLSHSDAVELYTFAISLIKDNAIYYCNRAAAYTQIHQYEQAIRDCLKSAEINPNYSKAYSRLGSAYYAQGKYKDALEKGFVKAFLLDPDNATVNENIRSAEQKLNEEQQRKMHQQNTSSSESGRGGTSSTNETTPTAFTINEFPENIASMFSGVASNFHQGGFQQHFQGMSSSSGPEVNINLNSGQQMPDDIAGALRSVMGMFSGSAAGGNPSDGSNERQAQS